MRRRYLIIVGLALCCPAAIPAQEKLADGGFSSAQLGTKDGVQPGTNDGVQAGGGGGGACTEECCNVHPTAGCSDDGCEAMVCDAEPNCCVFEWDVACQNLAFDLCGLEQRSDCCGFIGPGAVCGDEACTEEVCAEDPFCCDTSWDTLCGFEAQELCGDLCCCDAGEEEDQVTICHIPPGNPDNAHTITISSNALPAHLAHGDTIGECGEEEVCTEECCNVHSTPGCSDPDCEALVCDAEPNCCIFEWDLACTMAAADLCGLSQPSDCCGFIGPGEVCSDPACVEVVCGADPFCCDTSWDTLCGFEAQELCGDLCCGCDVAAPEVCTEECCNFHLGPGCSDPECEALVCAAEPLCCTDGFDWDLACQNAAFDLCGLAQPSDCCGFIGPGAVCSDPGCVEVVCASDPFCCDTSWDTLCGLGAQALCGDLCCCD